MLVVATYALFKLTRRYLERELSRHGDVILSRPSQ